jgi:ATP-dependent Clp protease ATP-binding subunit ClpC
VERIANGRREKGQERAVIVTGDDIIHIVSKWTGVPLNRMVATAVFRLVDLVRV